MTDMYAYVHEIKKKFNARKKNWAWNLKKEKKENEDCPRCCIITAAKLSRDEQRERENKTLSSRLTMLNYMCGVLNCRTMATFYMNLFRLHNFMQNVVCAVVNANANVRVFCAFCMRRTQRIQQQQTQKLTLKAIDIKCTTDYTLIYHIHQNINSQSKKSKKKKHRKKEMSSKAA